jgi:hypothetical protein
MSTPKLLCALLLGCALASCAGSVVADASKTSNATSPPRHTSTTSRPTINITEPTVEVKNENNTPDWEALFGPLGGAAVGGFATLLAAVEVARRREKAAVAREARKADSERRVAEAARVARLMDSAARAVAALKAFEEQEKLEDVAVDKHTRAFEAAVVLGGLQPVVADDGLQKAAKELFEVVSSVMNTPALSVRKTLIKDAAEKLKQLSAQTETVLTKLRDTSPSESRAAA